MKSKKIINKSLTIKIVSDLEYFRPLTKIISEFYKLKGHSVNITNGLDGVKSEDIIIVINPVRQFVKKIKVNNKCLKVAIQTEHIYNPVELGFDFFYMYNTRRSLNKIISNYDLVYDFSLNNVKFMSEKFNYYKYFHYGYHESFDTTLEDKSIINENYDIFFVGDDKGIDNRRFEILESLKSKFKVYPKNMNLWGEELYKAMRDSKICLNIHYDHSMAFEGFRLIEYFANERFVMSEYMENQEFYLSGQDYIIFDNQNLHQLVHKYLNKPDERKKIAKNAKQKILSNKMSKSVENLYYNTLFHLIDKRKNKIYYKNKYFIRRKILRFKFFRFIWKKLKGTT